MLYIPASYMPIIHTSGSFISMLCHACLVCECVQVLCEWVVCLAALKRKQRSGFLKIRVLCFPHPTFVRLLIRFSLLPSSYVHWATDGELMSGRLHLACLSSALVQNVSSCSSLESVDSSPRLVCWVSRWNPALPSDALTVALGLWVFVHAMPKLLCSTLKD